MPDNAVDQDLDVPGPRPASTTTTDEHESLADESTASTVSTESTVSQPAAPRGGVDVAEEARRTWRKANDQDQPLTGAQLGRLYDRSERWGRDRINEARAANPPAAPRGTKKAASARSRARARRQSATEQPNPARTSQPSVPPSRPAGIEDPPSSGEHPHGEHDDGALRANTRKEELPQNDTVIRDDEPASPPAPAPAGPSPEQRRAAPVTVEPSLKAPTAAPAESTPVETPPTGRRRWRTSWRGSKRAKTRREHAAAPTAEPTGRPWPARDQPVTEASPQVQASAWVWWSAHTAVVIVAAVALVTSYDHMRILALKSGEGWRAWLLPISVDGLMIAASLTILARRRAGQSSGLLAWSALIGGVAASVAANVAGAHPDLIARLVASSPPLAALASVELLMQHIRLRASAAKHATQPAKDDHRAVHGDEPGTEAAGISA